VKNIKLGCGVVVALFAAFMVAFIVFAPNTPSAPPAPKPAPKTPAVSIARDAASIELTNKASPDWKAATLYINGTPPDAYKITVAAPAVGKKIRIPLRDFAKKDGTRFDPSAKALTVIWVGGDAFDFAKFDAR
jgi:quinol-cytochrome oxidoreductase complex cytochrome b subunit